MEGIAVLVANSFKGGSQSEVTVLPTDTQASLYTQVAVNEGLNAQFFLLEYEGKTLSNSNTQIRDTELVDGCEVTLTPMPPRDVLKLMEVPVDEVSLWWQVLYGKVDTVAYLIAAGVDVNAEFDNQELSFAGTNWHAGPRKRRARHPSQEVLRAMDSQRGAVVGVYRYDASHLRTELRLMAHGATALHFACQRGYDSMVKRLLAAGANVHATTQRGLTALHVASWNGHDTTAKLLLADGADPHARRDGVETPLDYAKMHRHHFVISALKAAEARTAPQNGHGSVDGVPRDAVPKEARTAPQNGHGSVDGVPRDAVPKARTEGTAPTHCWTRR